MPPIIPTERPMISTDVPGLNISTSGSSAVGDALAGAGRQVENAGFSLLDEVKKSEAIEASSKAYFQDRYDSEDQIAKMKIQYPDGYVTDQSGARVKNPDNTDRTITQEYRDWADQRYKANQANMPSDQAQDLYKAEAQKYYSDALIKVRNDELILRTESFKRSMAQDMKTGLNRLVDTPSVQDAYALMDGMSSRIQAQKSSPGKVGLLSAQTANESDIMVKRESPQSLVLGLINRVLAEPKKGDTRPGRIQYALDVLQGNDPDSQRRKASGLYTVSDVMDPDQKAKYEKELFMLSQQAKTMDRVDLGKMVADAHADTDQGRPPALGPIIDAAKQGLSQGTLTDYAYADMIGGLIAHQQSNPVFNSPVFLLASPAQKAQIVDDLKKQIYKPFVDQAQSPDLVKNFPAVGGQMRQTIINDFENRGAEADKLARTDFVKFAQFDPGVKALTANLNFSDPNAITDSKTGAVLRARGDRLRMLGDTYFGSQSPDFRILSKDESSNLGNFLTADTTTHSAAATTVMALYNQDPKDFGSFMDQMIRDKNLGGEWRIILGNPKTELVSELVRNIRDGSKIREDAQKMGAHAIDFDTAVQAHAGPYLAGLTQQNQNSPIAETERTQIRSVLTTKAMDLFRQNGGQGSVDDYAKQATDAFLATRYKNISVGGGGIFSLEPGSRNSMNIPTVVNGRALGDDDFANVAANRNQILKNPGLLKQLGVVVPAGAGDVDPAKFYDQVSSTGRFVLNGEHTGYDLQYFDRLTNAYVPAITNQTDRRGKPVKVTVPIEQMIKKPGPNTGSSRFLERWGED